MFVLNFFSDLKAIIPYLLWMLAVSVLLFRISSFLPAAMFTFAMFNGTSWRQYAVGHIWNTALFESRDTKVLQIIAIHLGLSWFEMYFKRHWFFYWIPRRLSFISLAAQAHILEFGIQSFIAFTCPCWMSTLSTISCPGKRSHGHFAWILVWVLENKVFSH